MKQLAVNPQRSFFVPIVLLLAAGIPPAGASPLVPDIVVTPTVHDFGEVMVGETAREEVTVENGGGDPLVIGTIGFSLPDDEFAIEDDGCSGQQIAPASRCTLFVSFSPLDGGGESATLEIPSNDPDTSVATVALQGSGREVPRIAVDPESLDFGAVPIGNEASRSVSVTNEGGAGLTIGQLGIGGTDIGVFAVQNDDCSGQTIAPGGSCLVSVAFSPDSRGAKGATLVIPSDAVNNTSLEVPLSGEGTGEPDIEVDPGSLDFGTVAIGDASEAATFTLSNLGTADLLIGELIVIGRDADQFVIDQDGCSGATLPFGESCAVSLFFFPTTPGEKEGALRIPSNDPVDDLLDLPLSGVAERSCGGAAIGGGASPAPIGILCLLPLLLTLRAWRRGGGERLPESRLP